MPEGRGPERSLHQNHLIHKNPILAREGICFGLCSNFTLYCMKHWNEPTQQILNGWNNKLERNIYAEHPSDRFAERTHQYQLMQDASLEYEKEINIAPGTSFVESLFEARNGESESPGSNMIGLSFPLAGGSHIIEIVKRGGGYLIYDPNDDKLRFAATKQEADRIINSRARARDQFLTDFHITAMDEYLRKIGMINEDKPRQKDGKFPARLLPGQMMRLHNAIATNYNDEEFQNLLRTFTVDELNSTYRDGVGIIRYAIEKNNGEAIKALLEKGVDVTLYDIYSAVDNKCYRSLDTLLKADPNLENLRNDKGKTVAYKIASNALKNDEDEIIVMLINQTPPLDSSIWTTKDDDQKTLIDYLITKRKTKIIDMLYEKYPDITDFDEVKKRITIAKVSKALLFGNNKELEILINQTPPLDPSIWTSSKTELNIAPIDYLITKENTKIIDILCKKYSNVIDFEDVKKRITIDKVCKAIDSRANKELEMLINQTPPLDPSIWTTKYGNKKTPIDYLIRQKNTKIIDMLCEKYPYVTDFAEVKKRITIDKVCKVISYNDKEELEMLINQTPPLDPSIWTGEDESGKKPIDYLIRQDNTEIIDIVLENRPDLLNIPSSNGKMPLETAINVVTENNLSTIKTLINHGAKIDQNDDGTLDYKINFFQNEIKQASAKAQLYTKILEFLEEKKMAEEVVKAGRVLGASIAQDADATTVPTSPKEDSRKVGRR